MKTPLFFGVGQHPGILGQHKTEYWVNLQQNLHSTFKQFSENKSVITANKLLDYNRARVFLDDTATFMDEDFVMYSLRIDTADSDFQYPQGKIRDVFDDYFDQLGLFNRFAKTDLISYDEIKPYLIYQISIIADKNNLRKNDEFRKALWEYIIYYGYTDVKELCKKFGFKISIDNPNEKQKDE
ncbi:MAG: hypothetical protein KF862_27140 [Chitinophagaceae bacterium]|nr:hypothetical protein [Chitinophagaceae bacterium]